MGHYSSFASIGDSFGRLVLCWVKSPLTTAKVAAKDLDNNGSFGNYETGGRDLNNIGFGEEKVSYDSGFGGERRISRSSTLVPWALVR